eukprot:TRINITY_DN332_c0_g1_i1.p2 TRINITY_DN332_c0_g1~~TRINITY_DN332_c0_g1_i1.p2  ORF type:complete len:218 (-),score=48.95 TRINITY_DN332_c0_g1_i1:1310-1963(-)
MLTREFLRKKVGSKITDGQSLTDQEKSGLATAHHPGRCQIITFTERSLRFLIDGAHTPESVESYCEWLQQTIDPSPDTLRVLVFNCMSVRDPATLLAPLAKRTNSLKFHRVFFGRNWWPLWDSRENFLEKAENERRFEEMRRSWLDLCREFGRNDGEACVVPSIKEALHEIELMSKNGQVEVCAVGSLHLVGSLFKLLKIPIYGQPDFQDDFVFSYS